MSVTCPKCGFTSTGRSLGKHVRKCGVTVPELFFAKVNKGGAGGCWIWTGALNSDGYGHLNKHGARTEMYAHRYSYELHKGSIPAGMSVMHSCDVRKCVNPAHLSLGTHQENCADMAAKKRSTHGARNKWAKLTEDQVRIIRAEYRQVSARLGNGSELAKRFGVNPSAIYAIANGRTWRHIK